MKTDLLASRRIGINERTYFYVVIFAVALDRPVVQFLRCHGSILFLNLPPAEDVFVVNADTCPINTPLIFATP